MKTVSKILLTATLLVGSLSHADSITGKAFANARASAMRTDVELQQANSVKIIDGVEVVSPIKADPLVVVAFRRSVVNDDGDFVLQDSNGIGRVGVIFYRSGRRDIRYLNSRGEIKGSYDIKPELAESIIEKASHLDQCPLTLIFDRDTLRLVRMTSTCDDLAAIDTEDDLG